MNLNYNYGPGRRISALVVLAAQLSVLSCSAGLNGDWTTYGGGAAHSGYFPGALNGSQFVLKWTAPTPNFHVLQPVTGGGSVFVTAGWYFGEMSVLAFDATTGEALWRRSFASSFGINPPTYDGGAVYVQRTAPSALYKFDAVTGTTDWVTPFTSQSYYYMAPIVVDGRVYAGTGYYVDLTAYNQNTGAEQYSMPLLGNGCDQWTPSFYGGKVYTWVNGYFTEHDPTTGAPNWTLTNATSNEFLYSMNRTVAIADGRAYFTSTTKLMAVDLALKTNIWEVNGPFSGTPAIARGKVYAISNGAVSAYTTNGVYVNTYTGTNSISFSGQLIVTDDALLVGGNSGTYVFNLSDATVHQYITSFRTSCYCYYQSSFCLANNTLFIASGDSHLYAYSAEPACKVTIERGAAQNEMALRWPSEAGRTYQVLFATDLGTSLFLPISTNSATPPVNVLTLPKGSSPVGFYRLNVQ